MSLPRLTPRFFLTAVLLVLAGAAATAWLVLKETRIQRGVHATLLEQKMATTRNEFRLLLRPFGRQLATLDAWQAAGLLDPADPEALQHLVEPLLDPAQQVIAAYFVPETGPALLLNRATDGWRIATADSLASGWIAGAAAADTVLVNWSAYEELPGDGRMGLVAAIRSGDLVIGLALLEETIDAFTEDTAITENALFLRRFADGGVAWLTPGADNRLTVATADELLTSDVPAHGVIGAALRAWTDGGRVYDTAFTFARDRETWWGIFYPAVEGTDPGEFGLVVPADDLARRLEASGGRVMILLWGVLLLAVVTLLGLVLGYRSRWQRARRRTPHAPRDEAALRDLVAGGEDDRLEFKSTMRWNLHADKPGKEIELAWLKSVVAYLNTGGGFVLLGVADDGTVLGLEGDKFRNEDKLLLHFENLVKQHVGLEHAGRIRGELRDLDGKRVFLVACAPADEPVFLRHGEDEEFYVRVGPSSRRLPASRVLDWTRERTG